MTASKPQWYLIAYDVRDERRLQRLHYYLRKRATALQKSVFALHADLPTLAEVEKGLRERTDSRVDDLRLYAIPGPAAVWAAGAQTGSLDGLHGPEAARDTPPVGARLHRWVKRLWGREAA